MDSERLLQLRRDPPDRSRAGFMTLLLAGFQAFLTRLFGGKHPGRIDKEFGSYEVPDFVLGPVSTRPPPEPLINRDCKRTYLIYNFVSIRVERCTLAGQLAALTRAIDEVAQYQQAQFRCEDPGCPEPDGEIVWAGFTCDRTDEGPSDGGGVLVRLKCRVRR